MEGALVLIRPPEIIAAEINHLKMHTQVTVLNNAIEIGRRLVEAKQRVPHGEWGNWLETAVEFKRSTANNLMRIFEEYGSEQLSLFVEDNAKSQTLGKLNYSKAVALLSVPADEREDFIQENDVESMSTRDLQAVIKERDKALKELEKANKLAEKKDAEFRQLTEDKKKSDDAIADLQEELKDTAGLLSSANDDIEKLNEQIKATPIDVTATTVAEKLPDDIARELEELRQKRAGDLIEAFSLYFKGVVSNYDNLLKVLSGLPEPERDKYKKAVEGLIAKMSERL